MSEQTVVDGIMEYGFSGDIVRYNLNREAFKVWFIKETIAEYGEKEAIENILSERDIEIYRRLQQTCKD
jgi:hypothetical protein